MEFQDIPIAAVPEGEPMLNLDEELDRIAFELWQRGSLPEVAATTEAEVEEIACHASCL